MADLFGDSLGDPRTIIRHADVIDVIQSSASAFDAILLDVDNGPEGLTRQANDALYDLKGTESDPPRLATARRPGGVVVRAEPLVFEATAFRRFRGRRSRRPRHDKTQRGASCHLVCNQARRRAVARVASWFETAHMRLLTMRS